MNRVAARVDQVARVERITVGLITRCLDRGASLEEILLGLIGASISCRLDEDRTAQIEWIRTALDMTEREMLRRAGPTWAR
jgi:hypothetical protein